MLEIKAHDVFLTVRNEVRETGCEAIIVDDTPYTSVNEQVTIKFWSARKHFETKQSFWEFFNTADTRAGSRPAVGNAI